MRWLREDVLIADSNHPENVPPPRITLFNNGSLQVKNVRRNDSAEYLCEVMTDAGDLESQLHAIEVQCKCSAIFDCVIVTRGRIMINFPRPNVDPPQIISQPSGRIEVKLGTVFEIVCEAIGIPQPIITWRLNERSDHLEQTFRRRTIEVRSRDMAGPIECVATNGVGHPAVAGINMIVHCE